ncbi:MAG: hypothetical protein ABL907_16500 [Hyphomicrobium sp.]
MSATEFMRREFTQTQIPNEKTGFEILHDHTTREAFFAIVKRTDPAGDVRLFCLVCLIEVSGSEYGYKDMTESMGPNILAPLGFLQKLEDLIPEPDGRYAADWRDRCRAHLGLPEKKGREVPCN